MCCCSTKCSCDLCLTPCSRVCLWHDHAQNPTVLYSGHDSWCTCAPHSRGHQFQFQYLLAACILADVYHPMLRIMLLQRMVRPHSDVYTYVVDLQAFVSGVLMAASRGSYVCVSAQCITDEWQGSSDVRHVRAVAPAHACGPPVQ